MSLSIVWHLVATSRQWRKIQAMASDKKEAKSTAASVLRGGGKLKYNFTHCGKPRCLSFTIKESLVLSGFELALF